MHLPVSDSFVVLLYLSLQLLHFSLQLRLLIQVWVLRHGCFPLLVRLFFLLLLVYHDVFRCLLQLLLGVIEVIVDLPCLLVLLLLLFDRCLFEPDLSFQVSDEVLGLELHFEWQVWKLLDGHEEVVGRAGPNRSQGCERAGLGVSSVLVDV